MDATYFTGQVSKSNRNEILVPYEPEPRILEKWCYRCRMWKPYSDFYGNRAQHDGVSRECKPCDHSVRLESLKKKRGNP